MRHVDRIVALEGHHLVIADHVGAGGHVLLADERRAVSCPTQSVHQVLAIVEQAEPTVRQTDHAGRMGAHAGQQASAARRAGGGDGMVLPEQHALLSQPLDVGRAHGMAERLGVSPCVMRMDVKDVGTHA